MNEAELLLDSVVAACLRTDPEITVSEWADRFRYLRCFRNPLLVIQSQLMHVV